MARNETPVTRPPIGHLERDPVELEARGILVRIGRRRRQDLEVHEPWIAVGLAMKFDARGLDLEAVIAGEKVVGRHGAPR